MRWHISLKREGGCYLGNGSVGKSRFGGGGRSVFSQSNITDKPRSQWDLFPEDHHQGWLQSSKHKRSQVRFTEFTQLRSRGRVSLQVWSQIRIQWEILSQKRKSKKVFAATGLPTWVTVSFSCQFSTPYWGTASLGLACRHVHEAFSWLLIDETGYSSLWVVSSLGRWVCTV